MGRPRAQTDWLILFLFDDVLPQSVFVVLKYVRRSAPGHADHSRSENNSKFDIVGPTACCACAPCRMANRPPARSGRSMVYMPVEAAPLAEVAPISRTSGLFWSPRDDDHFRWVWRPPSRSDLIERLGSSLVPTRRHAGGRACGLPRRFRSIKTSN